MSFDGREGEQRVTQRLDEAGVRESPERAGSGPGSPQTSGSPRHLGQHQRAAQPGP